MKYRLFLEIIGKESTLYQVERLEPEMKEVVRLWRLISAEGEIYDVAAMDNGYVQCTCGSHTFRSVYCKHAKALRDCGMLR
jgi:hypothetical protein